MRHRAVGTFALGLLTIGAVTGVSADTMRRHAFVAGGIATGNGSTLQSEVGGGWAGGTNGAGLSLRVGYLPGGAGGDPLDPSEVVLLPPPGRLGLPANHPNPFNPATTLQFEIPADAGRVVLRIIDLRGRLIAVLLDGSLPEGRGTAIWRGVDQAGHTVGSGVYVAVLSSEHETVSRRLTLLK